MRLIQHLNGETEVKTAHHRHQIWDNDGELQGSLYINKAKLIWCKGKTQQKNGKSTSWEDFIKYMSTQ